SLHSQSKAELVVGLGIVWPEADRFSKCAHRVIHSPMETQSEAQVVVSDSVFFIQSNDFLEVANGLVQFVEPKVSPSAVVEQVGGVIPVEFYCPGEVDGGPGVLLQLQVQVATVAPGDHQGGVQGNRFRVVGE